MNVLDMFRLDGKTAVVTGARRGIGKAMAIALAEAGADIIGVSASLEASGSEIEQAVTSLGRKFSLLINVIFRIVKRYTISLSKSQPIIP